MVRVFFTYLKEKNKYHLHESVLLWDISFVNKKGLLWGATQNFQEFEYTTQTISATNLRC